MTVRATQAAVALGMHLRLIDVCTELPSKGSPFPTFGFCCPAWLWGCNGGHRHCHDHCPFPFGTQSLDFAQLIFVHALDEKIFLDNLPLLSQCSLLNAVIALWAHGHSIHHGIEFCCLNGYLILSCKGQDQVCYLLALVSSGLQCLDKKCSAIFEGMNEMINSLCFLVVPRRSVLSPGYGLFFPIISLLYLNDSSLPADETPNSLAQHSRLFKNWLHLF